METAQASRDKSAVMRFWRAPIIALVVWIALSAIVCVHADEIDFTGRVVAIADGDTLTLLTAEQKRVRVRLAEIDAPEKGQPYGLKAKQILSDLCFDKMIRAMKVATDRYGRIVARVYVTKPDGEIDVSAEMIRQGAAWAYRKYLTDRALLVLEEEAKTAGRGLWTLPAEQRIPPWEWRHPSPLPVTPGQKAPGLVALP
jgi:endonuclease YncB( thermonuclease family)